ncbi:MAG: ATP-binding protein [Gallionellaceae bacterium]|nr:ATP-binding protein [Gallionellaceae bacterium]
MFVWSKQLHQSRPFLKPQIAMSLAADDLWRSLYYFSFYRLILGGLLMLLAVFVAGSMLPSATERAWIFRLCLAYIFLTLGALVGIQVKRPAFSLQLAFQVVTDIVVIAMLTYFSGGVQSNLGMLLLVTLAAAGLISRGRITLFYAALASIAILLEHAYSVLTQDADVAQFLQAGILCASYFAVAWLAHALSKYAVASEKLAFTRGVDLSNMAEANRLMIQDMPDGVLVVDERGIVRQSNPSAERLLGISFALENKIELERYSPLLAALFAAWRQNSALGNEVLRLPDTHRLVRVRFSAVQRESFWGVVIVLEDMQRVQDQAQQVKLAALGRLTANIAHEVRNPLSSISYAAELLKEGQITSAQARLTQIILDNTARLNRIVQDVMQLNRRDRVNAEEIDLAQRLPSLVEEIIQSLRLSVSVIETELLSECKIMFDGGHFDQVIWNLCQNAIRYCQGNAGDVELRISRNDEGRVLLDVMDNGPGIDAETTLKLFEPFFTTESGGTGLGLYIARELCEANGATLNYSTRAEGGACFQIVFGVNNEH